jgi:cyclopropane fatty-acyl-phospholipid synthase-like methyltransferase
VLDLGCGSGVHTVALAERGWKATGVDFVPKALDSARKRIAERAVEAEVVEADVTELPAERVGSGFDFFLDVGCFHGLTPDEQRKMGHAVTSIAAPHATMLIRAFEAGALPRPFPRGADTASIEEAFPGWAVVDTERAVTDGMPKPLRKAAPSWYRLRRQG